MKKSKHTASSLCPCGSGKTYEDCCGRYHAGTPAPDARSLMASRYSAYALGLEKYVRDTWCEENCPADLDLKTNPITWLGFSNPLVLGNRTPHRGG
ncbi:MAG: YchJ family metal-binding protein [Dakarella massiliensis]